MVDAPHVLAQCSQAPATLTTTCNELQSYLTSFQSALSSQWNGQKTGVTFGTELLSANDSYGLSTLLAPSALNSVIVELNAFSALGVQEVTFPCNFPVLYEPFYSTKGVNYSYNDVLNFYKMVVAEIRRRGMKIVMETGVLDPLTATDLPLKQYYSTLSFAQVAAGRAQTAQVMAQELQPDWLNLGSEPDTQSAFLGLPSEYTPQQYASLISTIVTQLRGAGINGKPLLGAGIVNMQQNAIAYIQALGPTGIDDFDMHVLSANLGWLADVPNYMQTAKAAGIKGLAVSEARLTKASDEQLQGLNEYQTIDVLGTAAIYLNAYSFWQPLDTQFNSEAIDLAYWQDLYYLSFYWSPEFFAYLSNNSIVGMTSNQVQSAALQAANSAYQTGALTATGQALEAAIAPATRPATVSAASGSLQVASDSIVSVYGPTLGGSGTGASTSPLPPNLGGVSVTLADSQGVLTPAGLFYAGPQQINAYIPPGVHSGLAALTVTNANGSLTGPLMVNAVAPGLFAANSAGKGVAAAILVTDTSGNKQSSSYVFQPGCSVTSCAPNPIDLSQGSSALELFGTGIRNFASLSDVTISIGGQTLPAAFAGPAPGFTGLDQVNVALPGSLAGSGTVDLTVSVAGAASNSVTVTFK